MRVPARTIHCGSVSELAALLLMTSALSAQAQISDEQHAALKEISDYAEHLCTTVGTTGRVTEWKGSGEASAGLKGLAKFLVDLGFKISGEVSNRTTEGVVQSDLGRILEAKGNCKLRVFSSLHATFFSQTHALPPPAPPAPPAPSVEVHLPRRAQSQTVSLAAMGLPSMRLGMTIQEFAAAKPSILSIKEAPNPWGGPTRYYEGFGDGAAFREYVNGLYTIRFAGMNGARDSLSAAIYHSASYYSFSPLEDPSPKSKGDPEINCAESAFQDVMTAFVSVYGMPVRREREPRGSWGNRAIASLQRFGDVNPCRLNGACILENENQLNYQDYAEWDIGSQAKATVFRHIMGYYISAAGSPVDVLADCEIEVTVERKE